MALDSNPIEDMGKGQSYDAPRGYPPSVYAQLSIGGTRLTGNKPLGIIRKDCFYLLLALRREVL